CLMAVVAEGERGRVFLPPIFGMEAVARQAKPQSNPDVEINHWPGRTNVVEYGLTKFGDLFTARQLVALTTFSDLVQEARERALPDGVAAGLPDEGQRLDAGGTEAAACADAVAYIWRSQLAELRTVGLRSRRGARKTMRCAPVWQSRQYRWH